MRWDPEVQAAVNQARRLYRVTPDPALVHAVIEKETIHGALPITGTREPNGRISYGPMQVMDTTAVLHRVPLAEARTLATPSIGIRIGTFELARLLTLFGGDTARAVAAYNAGPGNARRDAHGNFFNQPYVTDVLNFWQRFKTTAVAVAPAGAGLIAVALLAWWLLGRGRRIAWGTR
jgi:soluble lytic murein transglycosylase-like protein